MTEVPQIPDLKNLPKDFDFSKLQEMIPKDIQEKLKKTKEKAEKLKDKVIKKFEKYILAVSVLPPPPDMKPEEKDLINLLILINDNDSKKISPHELITKLTNVIDKMADEIDKDLKPQIMLLSELREACFDGKYDIIKMIAMSASIYDPSDLLAALKVSEVHKSMVLKKFDKYILSYVAAGSLFRGEKSHDIDVYIVVDDTDVKRMPLVELRDKLRAIATQMGLEANRITGVQKQIHVQTYILTDFWESVKDANPVIYTFLRDGIPLYDRGVFGPWRLLLKQGRIRPSREAIDMNMSIGEKLLQRIKFKLLSVVGEDLFYAVLNPSQAALMLYGVPPPTPKETVKVMDEIFVKKEKMLEKKYIDILENIRKYFKDIEHQKVKEIKGAEIDKLVADAEEYLKRIEKLFNEIQKKYDINSVQEIYDSVISVTRDAIFLVYEGKVKDTEIEKLFKEKLIETGKLPNRLLRAYKGIVKSYNDANKGKVTKEELTKLSKEARLYIKDIVEYVQRSRGRELEKAKIRFKYEENKYGEVLLLDDIAFLTFDMENKDDIQKAKITTDGGLKDLDKSSLEEMDAYLAKVKLPNKVFIKEKIFEDLRKLFGKDVEVLVTY